MSKEDEIEAMKMKGWEFDGEMKVKNPKEMIAKVLSENGYITGWSVNQCTTTPGGDTEKDYTQLHRLVFPDHFGQALACDPTYQDPLSPYGNF